MKWSNIILEQLGFGKNIGNSWDACGVSTDTRTLKPGELFIALKGPNFDGNAFVDYAYKKNAVASIVSDPNMVHNSMPLFLVPDSVLALQNMAAFIRKQIRCVIGVTGSNGKTTTKEMIAALLKNYAGVHCNSGNLNNHIGLPLTLVNTPLDTAKYVVLEMGMSNFKEISLLSKIANPNIAVITNIGLAHIEKLHSGTNIAFAKSEIFEGMPKNSVVVLNIDDVFYDLLRSQVLKFPNISRIITFGKSTKSDFQFLSRNGDVMKVRALDTIIECKFACSDKMHFVYDCLAAMAVVSGLDLKLENCIKTLSDFSPLPGRGKVHNIRLSGKNVILIDHSYNANPESMIASLSSYHETGGRKVAILGDMLELGERSATMHLKLLPYIKNIDLIITVGAMMHAVFKRLPGEKEKFYFEKVDDLIKEIDGIIKDGDSILIKASNSIKLSKLVDYLLSKGD